MAKKIEELNLEIMGRVQGVRFRQGVKKKADKLGLNGFVENKEAAKEGGTVAGVARKELEQRSSQKVSTTENYLSEPEKKNKLENKTKK